MYDTERLGYVKKHKNGFTFIRQNYVGFNTTTKREFVMLTSKMKITK